MECRLKHPITIYGNWAAYDELSDNVVLTEQLALRQLDELVRLRRSGAQFEAYLMDAFWFARDGGYRTWRSPNFPDGPDRWLDACVNNELLPGLWFSVNTLCQIDPITEWQDSLDPQTGCACLIDGGYLEHFSETLHYWADKGIKVFKFDFANFHAATPRIRLSMLPSEVYRQSVDAFRTILFRLRSAFPDVLTLMYNGIEEKEMQTRTDAPIEKVVDECWLECFDAVYCGDPRMSDVPSWPIWRSMDIYSDHMVRAYNQNGFPLKRIENCGLMLGNTGTCYKRGKAGWRSTALLSLLRGGWCHFFYGDLSLLTDDDAVFFAKAQKLARSLLASDSPRLLGGMPGERKPYGYKLTDENQTVEIWVNPTPERHFVETQCEQVYFSDAGVSPMLVGGTLELGPWQIAAAGSNGQVPLGYEPDVVTPRSLEPIAWQWSGQYANGRAKIRFAPKASGDYLVGCELRQADGLAARITSGSATIDVSQNGAIIDNDTQLIRPFWSGLSWTISIVRSSALISSAGVEVTISTESSTVATIQPYVWAMSQD